MEQQSHRRSLITFLSKQGKGTFGFGVMSNLRRHVGQFQDVEVSLQYRKGVDGGLTSNALDFPLATMGDRLS